MELELELYTVDLNYIKYLKEIDKNVPNVNYGNSIKPFIGTLIKLNDFFYLAPLSSAKPKHESIPDSLPTIFKIKDENKKNISVILLNNMIPVKKGIFSKINLENIDDYQYKSLLNKEIIYIRKHKDIILKKAETTYNIKTKDTSSNLKNICCNFLILNDYCLKYKIDID